MCAGLAPRHFTYAGGTSSPPADPVEPDETILAAAECCRSRSDYPDGGGRGPADLPVRLKWGPMRTARSTLLAFGAAVAVLAAAGQVLAPSWQRGRLAPEQGFDALPEAPAGQDGTQPTGQPAAHRDEVWVDVPGDRLGGTVISPALPGRHPAVVFVHGAGPATRARLLDQAEALAAAGIVSLVYDKRRAGYSWAHRDYAQLADDALAMVRLLRARPDVDPGRVGLWGVSEGGWVVPLAAAASADVGFAVLVNAPTVTPGAQVSWAIDDGLRRVGAPAGARRLASRAVAIGGAGYIHYDPVPALRGVRQPVLALYGTGDRAVPPAQSARTLVDILHRSGNEAYTVRFFGGADHGMRVDGGYAPGYLATMRSWILGLPASATAGPRVAGATPRQADAASVPPTPWYGGAAATVTGYGIMLAGYAVAFGASRAARRRPADAAWDRVRRPLRRMAVAGVGTGVSLNAAIGALVALGFTGGPAVAAHAAWALPRLAALTTAGLGAAAVVEVGGALRQGWQPSPAVRTAIAGSFGATAVVLLVGAYWDLFAPLW